jgi:hypothetical protein
MKRSGFKQKFHSFHSVSGLKSIHQMRKFRKVVGENKNILQVDEADRQFSILIRKRDGQCVSCGSTIFLGCSHFYGRGTYATRFDPDNCITLCQQEHEVLEYEKEGIYRELMIKRLGEERFKVLEARSKLRVSPYEAIVRFMETIKNLENVDIQY